MKLRSRQAATATMCSAAILVPAITNLTVRAEAQHQHINGGKQQAAQKSFIVKSDDPRQLVSLPDPMREHMLANMRDHLATLDAVIGDVAGNKFDAASKLLEERLGMSSLSIHQDGPVFSTGDARCRHQHASCRESHGARLTERIRCPEL